MILAIYVQNPNMMQLFNKKQLHLEIVIILNNVHDLKKKYFQATNTPIRTGNKPLVSHTMSDIMILAISV